MTPDRAAKISAALKGRQFTPEHRAKIAAANKGKSRSPEVRARISATLKAKRYGHPSPAPAKAPSAAPSAPPAPMYTLPPERAEAAYQRAVAAREAAYAEDAEHTARADADFRQPESALAFLTDCHGGDDCEGECPAPVTVLEVLTASTMRPSMRARVLCADGTVRTVRAWCHYSHGSQWEPPDADVGYEYE